ncbi:MAG: hypothetical protein HC886_12955 [Leptolyngbyaceae cyanobacterium SM1_1_3]|nr:hypothetical protein [Leptolyngbyaceae cyanobacterium SM1_1_3]NJN02686.1 hypothetical protein [Leptolyngbyaceae cyanobacterium RM1_1_2]
MQPQDWLSQKGTKTGAIALSVMALLLPACTTETSNSEIVDPSENVTAEEVSDNVSSYLGQSVSVRGEAEEKVDDTSFILSEDELFGGEQILVVNASGEPFILSNDYDDVQVTGEVQNFVLADFETEFNLTLDPALYADYEDRPVIVAQSLALAPDPGELTEDPEVFYGQRIAVEGEVEELWSDGSFRLDEEQFFGGEGLLVITQDQTANVQEGEDVAVTGTLRSFVAADFERDYDLTWDLDVKQQLEAEYENKPVFVADEVYPSAQ